MSGDNTYVVRAVENHDVALRMDVGKGTLTGTDVNWLKGHWWVMTWTATDEESTVSVEYHGHVQDPSQCE
jgi:hypothetical protein